MRTSDYMSYIFLVKYAHVCGPSLPPWSGLLVVVLYVSHNETGCMPDAYEGFTAFGGEANAGPK